MLLRMMGTSLRSCVQKTGSPFQNDSGSAPASGSTSETPTPIRTSEMCGQTRTFSSLPKHDFPLRTGAALNLGILEKVKSIRCQKRSFVRPALDARDLQVSGSSSSATLLEMKKFFRQKIVDFTESHSCLIITLPKRAVSQNLDLPSNNKLFSFDEVLEKSLTKVFVNKTTSRFVCPEEAVFGDWLNLRSFLLAWQKQKFAKKGDVLEPLPPLGHSLNLDQVRLDN